MTSKPRIAAVLATIITVLFLLPGAVARAEAPVKLLPTSQYGAKVNLNETSYCVKSECEPTGGQTSILPGGFAEVSPAGVAVDTDPKSPGYGNIYIADHFNNRVQELTPSGEFVLMFGKDVNETTGGNVCTETEIIKTGVKCQAGTAGTKAGELEEPEALAIDPQTGNIYITEVNFSDRVDEFTEDGVFVLTIGKEVNKTKDGTPGATTAEKNLCTAASGDACKAGVRTVGATEHGAFNLDRGGDGIAAGGPDDLLYVGDEHRVQEFKPDGTWVQDLSLTSLSNAPEADVRDLALVQSSGELYVVYGGGFALSFLSTVFRFDAAGQQVGRFDLPVREAGFSLEIESMAVDSSGRLAVVEHESKELAGVERWFGSLLNGETGVPITGFSVFPEGKPGYPRLPGVAFSAGGVGTGEVMYGAYAFRKEVVGYVPSFVAEPVTGSVSCVEAGEVEELVRVECSLGGQINPESIGGTEAWFLWSATETALGGPDTHETSPHSDIATGGTLVPVPAGRIAGLLPNEPIHFQLDAADAVEPAGEPPLTGGLVSTVTTLAAPRVLGAPQAAFVTSSSVVLSGSLNPENASSEAYFEYAPSEYGPERRHPLQECPHGASHENCPGVLMTSNTQTPCATSGGGCVHESTPTTLEARELQPATSYEYRLVVDSRNATGTETRSSLERSAPEDHGLFSTLAAPVPSAQTLSASVTGPTSAVIGGAVNPDGQPGAYRFEVGVDAGPGTQYGIVLSGALQASTSPVFEELALNGLQPGTRYAYRIVVQSAYGTAYGTTMTFTTRGLPEALTVPGALTQLPVPAIAFPTEPSSSGVTTKKLTRAQQLAAALKTCARKPKRKRAACVRQARKRYGKTARMSVAATRRMARGA